jgi:hypothetical protein
MNNLYRSNWAGEERRFNRAHRVDEGSLMAKPSHNLDSDW